MAAVATRALRSGNLPSPAGSPYARSDFPFPLDSPGPSPKKEDPPPMSRLRASSDPISRGGAFVDGEHGALEQEPNPFEHSFSGPHQGSGPTQQAPIVSRSREPTVTSAGAQPRRARSNSPPAASRLTPGGITKLPPLALISTPSTELSNFGWGVDSLRTGPLSPALLNGPQPLNPTGLYDPSNLRTGLTPLASGVSFPPPSPATAALFAMMTNNTPGTADAAMGMAGGGPRPHEGPNEGNHFEASFAQATTTATTASTKAASDGRRASEGPLAVDYQLASLPLQSMQRSQLSSALGSQPPRAIAPQAMHPSHVANQNHHPYQQMLQHQHVQHQHQMQQHEQHLQHHRVQQAQQQQHYGNQNPLYLLSQAQDLSSHNDDAVVAAAALSNLGGPAGYPTDPMAAASAAATLNGVVPGAVGGGQHVMPPQVTTRGRTAASSPASTNGGSVPPPPGKGNKRGAAAATNNKRKAKEEDKKPPAKRGKRGKAAEPDDDDDDDDNDGGEEESVSPQPHNPNETEEEKRKNFLERNRQAALKCRQRKKAWLANLQSKVELLTTDNDTLQSTVTNLKDEVASLRAILAAHSNCPIAINNQDRRQVAAGHFAGGAQRF